MKPKGIIVVIYSDFLQNICHGTSQNSLFKLGKARREIFALDLNFSRAGGFTAEQHQGRAGTLLLTTLGTLWYRSETPIDWKQQFQRDGNYLQI